MTRFKGAIVLKNRHFIIQKRFNKLIHGINTIINVASDSLYISAGVSFLNWIKNKMIFYRISELMLPTLNQRYDINHFIFLSSSKTRDSLKVYMLSNASFYDRIYTIYQFINLSCIKNAYFEEYGNFRLYIKSRQELTILQYRITLQADNEDPGQTVK